MNVLLRFLSWISIYLVGTFFFLTAAIFVLVSVLSPENVKQTASEQGTYDKIVPAVLSSARSNAADAAGQLPLGEPWVRDAAVRAFPTADLQAKGDAVVDSTFTWLDGGTDKPNFSLDFTQNKEQFAIEAGSYTTNRLSGLPRCSLQNLPNSIDAFTIDCLPFGINPATIGNKVRSDIVTSQDFLPNPIISSDSVTQTLQDTGQDPFEQLSGASWLYQNRELLRWLFPLLMVLFAVIGLTMARNRIGVVGRLGRTFLVTAASLVAFALFVGFGFSLLFESLARDALSKEVVGPVFVTLAEQARTIYLMFAVIGAVIGVLLLLLQRKLSRSV